MTNLSKLSDETTARTNQESAEQRARNLHSLGVTKVLELCCGPSLKTLEAAYKGVGIECWGNDIDKRWQKYYPTGKWLLGDCLSIDYTGFNAIVFAPPVTRGCTGKREDSLMIEQITPRYIDFIDRLPPGVMGVLVLPARSLATRQDKRQYHKLLAYLETNFLVAVSKSLTEGRRKIRKYVDVYFKYNYAHEETQASLRRQRESTTTELLNQHLHPAVLLDLYYLTSDETKNDGPQEAKIPDDEELQKV